MILNWKPSAPTVQQNAGYEVNAVFRPKGIPDITFVDRSYNKACSDLAFELNAGGFVSVYGDSKNGKTVLCLKILKDRNPILLNGQHIATEAEFWNALSTKLGVPRRKNLQKHTTRAGTAQAGLKASIGGDLSPVNIKASYGGEETSTTGDATNEEFEVGTQVIIDAVLREGRPIVIDDFHEVPKATKDVIIAKMKPATDQGVAVAVVSIPQPEMTQGIGQQTARHAAVPAPLWEPYELRQIAVKGFAALNVVIDESTIEALVRYAYRNPLLMQYYCLRLCNELKIERTCSRRETRTVAPGTIEKIVTYIASKYEGDYAGYLRTEDERDEGRWLLKSGQNVNVYVLVVLALARLAINMPIGLKKIKERIEDRLLADGTDAPSEAVIRNALVRMTDRMQGKEDHKAPLRYDVAKMHAFVTHPFFKVYLEWNLLPQYPDRATA